MEVGSAILSNPAPNRVRKPSAAQSSRVPGHIPELDGMRGMAVLLVIFHHIAQNFPPFDSSARGGQELALWLRITMPGWVGVDVFFVLSGFLITGVLLDAKGTAHYYRNFYMKRILRIFPLYYAALVAMLFFFGWPWAFFGLCTVYLANVSVLFGVPLVMGPLWSLSVEEHFYFIWPWVIKYCRPAVLFFAALGICILEPFLRFWTFRHGGFDPYFSWLRCDGLAWGALVAVLVRSRFAGFCGLAAGTLPALGILLFAVALPFGGASRWNAAGSTVLYSCASLLTAGAIAFVAAYPSHRFAAPLRSAGLRFVGDISYCLYLIHMFAILGFYRLVAAIFHQPYSGGVIGNPVAAYGVHSLLVLAACCLVGWLSRDYFEGPIRRLRVYFQ